MSRLSEQTKQELVNLINKEISINNISKKLGLCKSTIYYYYKKVKGRKIISPKFEIIDSEAEGEIIGAFAADGCSCPQSQYQVTYIFGIDEDNYANDFIKLLYSYFNKPPYKYKRKQNNTIILRYKSKLIYRFIQQHLVWENPKTYSIKLKSTNHSKEFIKGYLRGYFDCDGYTEKKYSRIEIMSVSKNSIDQIIYFLRLFEYNPKLKSYHNKKLNKKRLYTVRLNKQDAIKFLDFIQPRNPKRRLDGAARI